MKFKSNFDSIRAKEIYYGKVEMHRLRLHS